MTLLRRIGLVVIAIGVLAVLLFFSLPIAIPFGLKLAGVDDITFETIDVGLKGTRIETLEIGEPPRQSVARIEIGYSLPDLVRGQLEHILVDGLVLPAVYRDGALSFSDGEDTDRGGEPTNFDMLPLADNLSIKNSRIDIETPKGMLSLPINAEMRVVDEQFTLELDSTPATLLINGDNKLQATIELSGELPRSDRPKITQAIASGRFELDGADIVLDGDEKSVSLSSSGELALADGRLSGSGPLTISGEAGTLDGRYATAMLINDDFQFIALDNAEIALDLADLDVDDISLDRGQATLKLGGAPDRLGGSLSLDLQGFSGSFGTVDLQGLALQRVFDLELSGDVLDIFPRNDGPKISIDGVTVQNEGDAAMESGWFTVQWPEPASPLLRLHLAERRFELNLGLEIDPVRIDLPDQRLWARIEDFDASFKGDLERLRDGLIRIKQGRVDLPSDNLALAGIESNIKLGAGEQAGDHPIPLIIRSVRPLEEPHLFSPLRLDADLNIEESTLDMAGALTATRAPKAVLDFTARYDRALNEGVIDLVLPSFAFGAGGRQPGDLLPILDGVIEQAEGRIALDGEITWRNGEIDSDIALLIEELGFTIGPARLSRINSVIRFDGIAPLTTPADQLLSVGLLDVGLPLTDGLVSMQLRPDGKLTVDQLDWHLADGQIRADPFTFGSDVDDLTLLLKAEQLNLASLLRLTPLDDLTGEGRIDGRLPLTIGETASLAGGELLASAPGVLRYTPSSVPGVLQAGGESVTLMLQALENFRYDALNITLDGRTDGNTAIGLHLKGANPDLHDGHPVEFNLNLNGNLASLVQTNLDNYQIPDRIRERLQGFER